MRWLLNSAGLMAMLVGLTLSAPGADAQMSLSSAVDLALRNDPRMKMAQADVAKARGALSEARDTYIPYVGATGGYGTSTGVPLSIPILFSISAQSLVFNFSQKDNLRAAQAALNAAELSLQEMREQIAEDVIVTYLDLEHEQRRKAAIAEEYGFATRLVEIVQARLNEGDDTRRELFKAKEAAAEIHYQRLLADDSAATLGDHLSRLVGLPKMQIVPDPASVPPLPEPSALSAEPQESFAIQAAFANAQSKQELAFGENRYKLRPSIGFGANYSRIYTNHTNFITYYPTFAGKNYNDYSIGIHIDIPLFDMGHDAKGREASADAVHARWEAESQKNQYLEGRVKLRHQLEELQTMVEIANDRQGIAKEDLDAVLAQLSANNASIATAQLSPKDEQNARLAERARFVDVLDAESGVQDATIHLMRQTGQLDAWLNNALHTPATVAAKRITP